MDINNISTKLARLESALMVVAEISLFAIMLIVSADVLARYLFHSPFGWSYELISLYLMVILFFFSVSKTLDDDGHIAVDILHSKISSRARYILYMIIYWLSIPVILMIWWLSVGQTWESYWNNEATDGVIQWRLWLSWLSVPIGTFLLALRLAVRAIGFTMAVMKRTDAFPLPTISGQEDFTP